MDQRLENLHGIRDMVPVEPEDEPSGHELWVLSRQNWFIRMAEDFHLVPDPDYVRGRGRLMSTLYPKAFKDVKATERFTQLMCHDRLKELGLMDPEHVHVIEATVWTGRQKRRSPLKVWVCKAAFPKRADAEAHLNRLLPDRSRLVCDH